MSYQFKLIGYPIEHSLSPWIHEQFLTNSRIDGTYALFEIRPDDQFEEKINQLKEAGVDGFNVTVPYKQEIIAYLDELDDTARSMQAVNTVVQRNGKWYGYNTDGDGYVRSLKTAYPTQFPKINQVLLIGAGGAARAIYYALMKTGVGRIDLANRTKSKATEIASLNDGTINSAIFSIDEAERNTKQYDLIIQTTSVGMRPNTTDTIIQLPELKESAIVSDIVYQPIKTRFLQQAITKGGNVHYGHTMLLYQAQSAFEIWTGKTVDTTDMDKKLQAILEGR